MTTGQQPEPTVEKIDLQLDLEFEKVPKAELLHGRPELTSILRLGGGVILTAAAITFMVQGVYSFSPMTRHWIMLVLCGLLGVTGVATGVVLKEEKGARAFLGFAAAFFPVLASQLGAMLFSLFGHPPVDMPQPLVFSLSSSFKVLVAAALTCAVAVPVSYLAFRVLARSQAVLMTAVFTLANLCILLPVRYGMGLGFIVVIMACGMYWVDNVYLRRDFKLESFEGRAARSILTGPLWVMLGRSFFYHVGPGFYGLMLLLAGAYLTFHWARTVKTEVLKKMCLIVGYIGLAAGWITCLQPLLGAFFSEDGMTVYLVLLPLAAILAVQSFMDEGSTVEDFRNVAACIALISIVVAHWIEATALVSVVGVVVALVLVAAGILAGQMPVFVSGLLSAAVSLGNFCLQAFTLHSDYAWVALALLGIGVIFSASLIEKARTGKFLKGVVLWGRFKADHAAGHLEK